MFLFLSTIHRETTCFLAWGFGEILRFAQNDEYGGVGNGQWGVGACSTGVLPVC